MRAFIGKKVTVSLGGKQPKNNPDEIVGSEIIVHVSEEDAKNMIALLGKKLI